MSADEMQNFWRSMVRFLGFKHPVYRPVWITWALLMGFGWYILGLISIDGGARDGALQVGIVGSIIMSIPLVLILINETILTIRRKK